LAGCPGIAASWRRRRPAPPARRSQPVNDPEDRASWTRPSPCPRRRCDAAALDFETTDELAPPGEPAEQLLGQERALEAIRFGVGTELYGFNLFVLGPAGTGRHSFVQRFLAEQAREQAAAADWCYVNNFAQEQKPRALELPAGRGRELREHVHRLLEEALTAVPAAFEGEDYQTRRQAIEDEVREHQSQGLETVQKHAQEQGIQLLQTPTGMAFAPVRDGEVIDPQSFQQLPEDERERIQNDIEALGKELRSAMQAVPVRVREARERIRELDREFAAYAVGGLFDELEERFTDLPAVVEHLERMRADVIEHVDRFRGEAEAPQGQSQAPMPAAAAGASSRQLLEQRYGVNLLVDNADAAGAPVVFADRPVHGQLLGRIEHRAEMGALSTDFSLIRAGVLHRANGGYLVIDARKVLAEPFAWEALKQALTRRQVRIESLSETYSLVSTISLEPEPIPLRVKCVLIGERMLYYLLHELDPEFSKLFKVAADFDDRMPRENGTEHRLARLIGSIAAGEGLRPLE